MKKIYTLLLLIFLWSSSFAQLAEGDIAFLHANADLPKNFSWVALVDIPGNEEIFFTEDGWNGTAFYPAITEAHILYTAPFAGLSAGTVVTITEDAVTQNTFNCSSGTAVLASSASDAWDFSTAGDQILAYIGTVGSPTKFIAGITVDYNSIQYNATTMWATNGLSNITSSALPPGLTNGVNAIAVINANNFGIVGELDNNQYNCTITSGTKAQLLAAINDYTNWTGNATTTYSACAASFTVVPSGPLPISLGEFSAKTENGLVYMDWQTFQEINSDRFEVEHSTDGSRWTGIGSLSAAGNSTIPREYSFIHRTPVQGDNFYRLQLVDRDGSHKFSKVTRVLVSVKSPVKVYPSTTSGYLVVELNNNVATLPYIISDRTGKLVKKGFVRLQKEDLNISALSPGLYFIRVQGFNAVKFIKY